MFSRNTSPLLGALKTQIAAGVSCDRMTLEYIPDEYCDMLLTLGTRNSRVGTVAGEYALRFLIDVIQILICFDDWSGASVTQEV
jgi:hypothetical protein